MENNFEYVVIQHALRDMNGNLVGVRFRGGYGVVQKGSKTYLKLKQLPLIKGQPEFPITHLRKLDFIINEKQVNYIYGPAIYRAYVAALAPLLEEEAEVRLEVAVEQHSTILHKCTYVTPTTGKLCQHESYEISPSGFCKLHLLEDPKLEQMGIIIPKRMTRDQRREFKEKVEYKLQKSANN
jgi:hypothetical protein